MDIGGSPGLVRVAVESRIDAAGCTPVITLECDPAGFGAIPMEGALRGETLSAQMEHVSLDLVLRDGALDATLALGLGFPVVRFELRHGHPAGARFQVSREHNGSQPETRTDGELDEALRAVLNDAAEGRLLSVDSLLVMRGDEVVADEYFYGHGPDDLHTWQSCTKSITSLLFGLLVDDGSIELSQSVCDYLPSRRGTRWIDERYDVSVHQMLSMSAGLEWDEKIPYSDPHNDAVRMNRSGNWIGYVLDRHLREGWPTGAFEYQSGLTLLAGEVIREVSGKSVEDLARERLFAPLGIERFLWLTTGDGTTHTGGGLFMRPRDVAKLGRLVLTGGVHNGRRILSEAWIDRSTTRQSADGLTDYGYQWWLPRLPGSPVMASGYGGQMIAVYREQDVLVVKTAHSWAHDSQATGRFPSTAVLQRLQTAFGI